MGTEGSTSTSGSTGSSSTTSPTTTETTDTGAFEGVIAPVVVTYRPRTGPEVAVAHDPLPELERIEIHQGPAADAAVFPAVYDGSTRLEFEGVPEVTYLLLTQSLPWPLLPDLPGFQFWVETAARELGDFEGIYGGRPDLLSTFDPATSVRISATGLPPLGEDDALELYSHNADALQYAFPSFDPLDGSHSPEVGATELVDFIVPWQPATNRQGWPLVDPGAGDDLWLGYLAGGLLMPTPTPDQRFNAWSYGRHLTLARVAGMDLKPMSAGATTALTGEFAPVAAKQVLVDFRSALFRIYLEEILPLSYSVSCTVSVFLEPGIEHPIAGMFAFLGQSSTGSRFVPLDPMCPPESCDPDLCASCDEVYIYPDDEILQVAYGNPFAGGTETLYAACRLREHVTHPLAGTEEFLVGRLEIYGALEKLSQAPIVPTLGLVRDLKIGGIPHKSLDPLVGVGPTPTISFEPPETGSPDTYLIRVISLKDLKDLEGTALDQRAIGSIETTATTLTLPAGLLQEGSFYYLQIVARRGEKLGSVVPYTHDQALATAYSAIFSS